MSDLFLFGVFPYLAVALAVGGMAYRWRAARFTVTTRSSQLLEARLLFWGSVPWHPAILVILLAHVVAAVFPEAWGRLLGEPGRLYALEITGLALGLLAVLGVGVLLVRRAAFARRARAVDLAVLALLLAQAGTGVFVAFALRWGSVWYLHTAAPWLASLARLSPDVGRMAVLPWVVKAHVLNAFLLLALVPLTRLAHATRVPLAYLWRPPQRVVWRRAPAAPEEGSR